MASALATFRIPASEIRFFKQFLDTSGGDLQKLADELQFHPPTLNIGALCESIAPKTGLSVDDVNNLIGLLWRLTLVRRRYELGLDDFVSALDEKLSDLSKEVWTQENREHWNERRSILVNLLNPDGAVAYGAKATELFWEQPLVFCAGRVITDLRPVFDDPAEALKGFLPFHTLVLRCLQNTEEKDIYIAMDVNDVRSLRKHLERAERKENLVRNELTAKQVSMIDAEKKEG